MGARVARGINFLVACLCGGGGGGLGEASKKLLVRPERHKKYFMNHMKLYLPATLYLIMNDSFQIN